MIKTLKKIYLLRKYNVKLKFKLKYAEITELKYQDGRSYGIKIYVEGEAIYVRNTQWIDSNSGKVDTVFIKGKRFELGI